MSYNIFKQMGSVTIAVNPQDLYDMIVDAVKKAISPSSKEGTNPNRKYLTTEEVMERLNISRSTLDRKRKMGILVPVKIGKLNRYRIEDVEQFEQIGE